jgi:hypothetical protein
MNNAKGGTCVVDAAKRLPVAKQYEGWHPPRRQFEALGRTKKKALPKQRQCKVG